MQLASLHLPYETTVRVNLGTNQFDCLLHQERFGLNRWFAGWTRINYPDDYIACLSILCPYVCKLTLLGATNHHPILIWLLAAVFRFKAKVPSSPHVVKLQAGGPDPLIYCKSTSICLFEYSTLVLRVVVN